MKLMYSTIAIIVIIVLHSFASIQAQKTKIEAPLGRAKVPLRNYVPLVGEEVYGKQQQFEPSAETGGSNSNSMTGGDSKCCLPTCACNGVTTCCAKKIKLFKAQTVKRGSLDPKDFVLQPNNRDTKVANDIPCETNCPDNAKKIGTSADSPMYPKDNAAPEKVVITNSALPATTRSDTTHLCPCCFKATTDPSIKCSCCGSIGN